jgi:hypothetical protein
MEPRRPRIAERDVGQREGKDRLKGEGNLATAHSPAWSFGRGRQAPNGLKGMEKMRGHLIELAEELVHARPANEDEARAALEWIAARDGKGLAELIEERRRLHAIAS